MPSPRHAFGSVRVTLVTAGLSLGCLGGVAGGATVVLSADASPSVARTPAAPVLRPAADRATVAAVLAAPVASAAAGPAHTTNRASRSRLRRGVHPRPPRRPLRFGARGSAVRWVQLRLGVPHTGQFARHTRAAVRRFQRHHHLHADGVVGRRTWTLLARTAPPHHSGARRDVARHVRSGRAAHHVSRPHVTGHHVTRRHAARPHLSRHDVRHGHVGHRSHHPVLRRSRPLSVHEQIRLVLQVARAQRGKPYVWGAAGPRAFDCSGYVQWVFRHAIGRPLPKYTDTQYRSLPHIRRSKLRPGDLVFVREGRHESHVGIYAGHHRWWVAPHTGSHVKLQRVWGSRNVYARVIT